MRDAGAWERVMAGVVVKSRQILAMLGKESLNNLLVDLMWDLIE